MAKVHTNSTEYFNSKEFDAYLLFMGLNQPHTFIFTAKGCFETHAKTSSLKKKSSATAVNIYPQKKGRPSNKDITQYQNLTFDFEDKTDPSRAVLVAETFISLLAEKGYCHSRLPYVISGAGVHIHIPIEPISVKDGEAFNTQVKSFVLTSIQPLFDQACLAHACQMTLECYDIARLLSAPGTYRAPKSGDHPSLAHGFVRHWSRIPESREEYLSPTLRTALLSHTRKKVTHMHTHAHAETKKITLIKTPLHACDELVREVYRKQIENIARQAKKCKTTDRSVAFAVLVNTFLNTQRKKGKTQEQALELALLCADIFDTVAGKEQGPKYQGRAQNEVIRLWNTFLWGGVPTCQYQKTRNVTVSQQEQEKYQTFLHTVLVPSPGARVPIENIRVMSKQYGFSLTEKQIGQLLYGKHSRVVRERKILLAEGKRQPCIVGFQLIRPETKYRLTLVQIELLDTLFTRSQGTGKREWIFTQKMIQFTLSQAPLLFMNVHTNHVPCRAKKGNKDPPPTHTYI